MYVHGIKHELLQSPLWGNVQEAEGRRIFYVDRCLLIKHPLLLGFSWLYSPRPAIHEEEQLKELIPSVAAIAKKENAVFWKIDGLKLENWKIGTLKLFSISSPLQPPETLLLDLSQSEDELLGRMKEKTRYNIRLAQKKGVTTRWSKDVSNIPLFYNLLKQTAARQAIRIHSQSHYTHILNIVGEEDAAALIIAESEEKIPIAANLVTFFGGTATYLHGGTDNRYRALMAPYLLQWETIQEAKRRGLRWYDLGGCAVTRGKIKEWTGITRFKEGFGGKLFDCGKTYDVVFRKGWYKMYKKSQRPLCRFKIGGTPARNSLKN